MSSQSVRFGEQPRKACGPPSIDTSERGLGRDAGLLGKSLGVGLGPSEPGVVVQYRRALEHGGAEPEGVPHRGRVA